MFPIKNQDCSITNTDLSINKNVQSIINIFWYASSSGKKTIFIQASKYYSHITDAEKFELVHISKLAGAIPILAYTLETYNDKQRWRFKDARTFTEFQFK